MAVNLIGKGHSMAIVLTNGMFYIATTKSGGILKTPSLEEAQTFFSVNSAMMKIFKAPGKCKGYYPYDTEDKACKYSTKRKRRKYSEEERKIIYDGSNGHCALCGQKLLLKDMTIDHIVPLSMGGNDDMDNVQASCFSCNQFKDNILPEIFMDRIEKIFLHQAEKNYDKNIKLKIIHKLLESM